VSVLALEFFDTARTISPDATNYASATIAADRIALMGGRQIDGGE